MCPFVQCCPAPLRRLTTAPVGQGPRGDSVRLGRLRRTDSLIDELFGSLDDVLERYLVGMRAALRDGWTNLFLDEIEAVGEFAQRIKQRFSRGENAKHPSGKGIHQVEDGACSLVQIKGYALEPAQVEEGRVICGKSE